MPYHDCPGGAVHALIFSLLVLACSAATAESQSQKALVFTHDDPRLEWGPCPEFLPEGCTIAVLHGDPAASNADIFFKVPGGAEIPHHWHTSAERMILVSGELEVNYDGQEAETMRPGSYGYGPAKAPHHATCAPGDACVLFIAFEEPVDAIPSGDSHSGH